MKDAVCRLCLAVLDPDDSDYSILNHRFRKALENVFSFKIRYEVDLPVHTCNKCSYNVLDFQQYSELVKKNQEKLEDDLMLKEHRKSTTKGDTEASDDIKEENVKIGSAAIHLSKASKENPDDDYAFTAPTYNEACLDSVKVAYKIHPDHETSTMPEEVADIICEEYLITSSDTKDSNYTTMRKDVVNEALPTTKRLLNEDENNISNADEADQKKIKISTPGCASARENNLASDLQDASAHGYVNISEKNMAGLNEQTNEVHLCDQCGIRFTFKWQLEYHMQEHVVLKCPFCQKTVPVKTLSLHIATHQDAFSCNTCNKKFINQRQLKQHTKKDCAKRS